MKLEGQHPFKADPALVYGLLHDPEVLARCIPGCESLTPEGPGEYSTTLKVGISSIQGVYRAKVKLDDSTPPARFRIVIDAKGPQGFVRGGGDIELSPAEADTVVSYRGDAQLGGTLAGVGQRMLQGAAKMMVSQFFTAIEAEVEARRVSIATGEEFVPPRQGGLRNAFRFLWSMLRRWFARPDVASSGR